jgi:hypothetical protein
MKIDTDPKNDLWAFREGRRSVSGALLFRELARSADDLSRQPADGGLAVSALMCAGEFEAGLADANSKAQIHAQRLTDCLASVFLGEIKSLGAVDSLVKEISRLELPRVVSVSPPEGFAYYALHPHDFARLTEQVDTPNGSALVVGIRSIGTTLSAIVRTALQQTGRTSARITVRPSGHPYDRVVHFSPEQLRDIHEWNGRKADFLVVDEGPGRSGSSFLSVAEALTQAGVPGHRITLLGSRQTDVNQLCAQNARDRWNNFRFLWPAPSVYTRFSDHTYIAGGAWRDVLFQDQARWPACWPQMERLKFLSPDRQSIFKFEGFGRFGAEVLCRAEMLARAGFGCAAEAAGDGMIRYPVVRGRAIQAADVSTELLEHLARYCAFRAAAFRVTSSPSSQLPAMLGFNALHEFGIDLGSEMEELCTAEPILTDGRMHPHEWIRGMNSGIIKVDACTHGDDHFFPGPTDIAWDLAGAIVEWNLDDHGADYLISEFRRISGLDRTQAMPAFIVAYTVFRVAYWKMALSTVTASPEEQRVAGAYQFCRALAERQLRAITPMRGSVRSVAASSSGHLPAQPETAA